MRTLKDPSSVLDFTVDWAKWLAAGETITAHTVTVPTGITLDSAILDGSKVIAWLSGGVAGTNYTATYAITTSAGRTDERSITVLVRDR